MPGFTESFVASKSFTFIAAAIAFLSAAILISVIFRFAFGRKVRLARNGRTRVPRLGTVDVFDLDWQRQLVIVWRDNVEHLLMIGGPNDLVIESQIIRAESREPRDVRDARSRDKEFRDREPRDTPLPAWPSTAEDPLPNLPQRKMPAPAAAISEKNFSRGAAVFPADTMPPLVPSDVPPPDAAFPFAPRRPASSADPSGPKFPSQREPLGGRSVLSQKSEAAGSLSKDIRRSVATPFLRPSPLRQTEGNAVRVASLSAAGQPAAGAEIPKSTLGSDETPASPEPDSAAEIASVPSGASAGPAASFATARELSSDPAAQADGDTLEAEMARLLGRRPG